MLKLYHYHVSPRSQRVYFLLKKAGIEFELVPVAMGAYEHREEAFLERNPLGRVPVLEVDGEYLAESNAILRFLALRFGLKDYYPDDLMLRARVDMWMDYGTMHIGNRMTGLAWQRHWLKQYRGQEGDPVLVASCLSDLERDVPILEAQLQTRNYLVADRQTLADISLYPLLATHGLAGYDLSESPGLSAWMQRMASDPLWAEASQ